jgi:hypothetical protein
LRFAESAFHHQGTKKHQVSPRRISNFYRAHSAQFSMEGASRRRAAIIMSPFNMLNPSSW